MAIRILNKTDILNNSDLKKVHNLLMIPIFSSNEKKIILQILKLSLHLLFIFTNYTLNDVSFIILGKF